MRAPQGAPAGPARSGSLARRLGPALGLGITTLILAACAESKPLNTFEPRGTKARGIYDLMQYLWPIMGVIFLAVVGGTIWLALKNRVKPDSFDPEDLPRQTHGNTRLEITWTVLPGLLLAAIAVPLVAGIWRLEQKSDADMHVMVIGQQWWWEFRYNDDPNASADNGWGFFRDANDDGVVDSSDQELPLDLSLRRDVTITANELVIPVGKQVDLQITSRDVIHSFWIPRLNGKRDAVPGHISTWSLEADQPGKYTGWCTEFCGLSHSRMRMDVIALPQEQFDQWLANQHKPAKVPTDTTSAAYLGREIFKNQCVSCHVINDGDLSYAPDFQANLTSGEAPNLTHFATRSIFAGGTYNQYAGPGTPAGNDDLDVSKYLQLSALAQNASSPDDYRWNTTQLKKWVHNAPEQKDMAPDDRRGMLPFPQLTDQQLDQVVAYLATLN